MQYVLLVDNFSGFNSYMAADKVGPGAAVDMNGVDVTSGSLKGRYADTLGTLTNGVWTGTDTYVPDDSKTIVPWGVGALGMSTRYAVARFGGKLYRSHKGFGAFPSDLAGIQYTSSIGGGVTPTLPTWDYLGLMTPAALGSVTDASPSAGAGVPAGTITYYATFYNADGQESPPATSTEKVITAAKKLTVTLPQAYTTATFTNGATTITVASNASLRLGMRITGTNIQADTYITGISGTSVTISKATTGAHAGSGNKIIDAQVVGTRLYRMGGGIEAPLLVTQTANLTTSSYADEKTNAQLGEALTTEGTADMPDGLRDISISPTGVLLCASAGDTVTYFSLVTPSIYNAAQVIKVSDSPLATIYALDRFICPTIRGAFSVTIDDAILGLPIVQQIDDTEPSKASHYVYATDVSGRVWWNTSKGIVSTDGATIETITRFTFSRELAESCHHCFGADFYNGEYFAYVGTATNAGEILTWNRSTGWNRANRAMKVSTSAGTLGFHITQNSIIVTGRNETPASVRLLCAGTNRAAGGTYKTGEWSGEKMSALKKFRKVSAVFKGSISIQPYVDGDAVGNALTGNNAKMSRVSWWLPSGSTARGRSIALEITVSDANVEVDELGVWVGEQREPMP